MGKNRAWISLLVAIIGAAMIFIGKFVFTSESMKTTSGWLIGFGTSALVLGIGHFVDSIIVAKSQTEDLAKRKDIEVHDERNIRIREKAGAAANRVVNWALVMIILVMGFMKINIIVIAMTAAVIFLDFILLIVLNNYYAKKM